MNLLFLFLLQLFSLTYSRSTDVLLAADAFEGDILGVDPKQLSNIVSTQSDWERGVVPFTIDSKLDFIRKRTVEKAMMRIQDQTCIRFVARQDQEDWLHFTDGVGCASYVGRVGGRQDVVVGPECDQVGFALHLLMHALGFWHEESSDDSPNYVLINWDNIKEEDKIHFQTYTHSKNNPISQPFDYRSLMHMSPFAYAINRDKPTILSKDERFKIGQRSDLSEGDVKKIVGRYCNRRPSTDSDIITDRGDEPSDNGERNLASSDPIASRTPQALIGARRSAKCQDASHKCPLWATHGDCYKRPAFMQRQCQESCRVCQSDQECTNYNSLCGVWAWMGRCTGGAGSSARQVLTTCPLACGVCVPNGADELLMSSGGSCQDKLQSCRRWARKGRCFYKHVLHLCPAACDSCEHHRRNGARLHPSSSTLCQDTWPTLRCAHWHSRGWCSRRNNETMRKHCKKTCQICSHGQSDSHLCEDVNPLCHFITRQEMCGTLIKLQCAKTCHTC